MYRETAGQRQCTVGRSRARRKASRGLDKQVLAEADARPATERNHEFGCVCRWFPRSSLDGLNRVCGDDGNYYYEAHLAAHGAAGRVDAGSAIGFVGGPEQIRRG